MQPYHKAAEAIRAGQEAPIHLLKQAGLTALGGGVARAGGKALGKMIPAVGALINKYVPDDLLQKGLSKIDPRFGKFIQGALDEGYTSEEVREFLGDKVEKSMPKEHRNPIEQQSPALHAFIQEKIKSGDDPIRAAALALFEKGNPHEADIRKIEKEHKTNWSQLVQSIYGGGQGAPQQGAPQQPQPQAPQPMQPQGKQGGQGGQMNDPLFQALMQGDAAQVAQLAGVNQRQAENLIMKFNQAQGGQQQQQGGGQGSQALQAILQKINQKLG